MRFGQIQVLHVSQAMNFSAYSRTAFQQPSTIKEPRQYLGMYQYYAKFAKQSSQWQRPLHALVNSTPRNRPLHWTAELTTYFIQSKNAPFQAIQLTFSNMPAATELVVDASGTLISAVFNK